MESRQHAIHSGLLALAIAVVAPPPAHPVLLVGFVLLVGVGIDADHFVLARLNTGSWKNLGRVRRDPRLVVLDQSAIFDTLDVWAIDRLFSHTLLGGLGVGVLWSVGLPYWAGVLAVTLYTHIFADLYDDLRAREQKARSVVEALEAT